jgi:hypothetical protein
MVAVEPADYIDQSHRDKTNWVIERVVEFVEESERPFTRAECWRASFGHYSITVQTLLSMKKAGLLVVTNPGSQPELLLSVDRWRRANASTTAEETTGRDRH